MTSSAYGEAGRCSQYQLWPVEDSNVYIAVLFDEKECSKQQKGSTNMPSKRRHCTACDLRNLDQYPTCRDTRPEACDCPCTSAASYGHCQDQYTLKSDDWPTCVPEPPQYRGDFGVEPMWQGISDCYLTNCSEHTSDFTCLDNTCAWVCESCVSREQCHQESTKCPTVSGFAASKGGAGIIFLIFWLMVVILPFLTNLICDVISVFRCLFVVIRRRKMNASQQNTENEERDRRVSVRIHDLPAVPQGGATEFDNEWYVRNAKGVHNQQDGGAMAAAYDLQRY
ncbi:PREDICTED: uncharacterized protein LOC106816256 isoform X1 [Priapulus caudatus]|uniref:Uncharacterized protein LOC106816256 isoform X1 n=1 Tax=Priapulus caudatus TaxID=37621 RepID=A0ABM1EVV1_PRICU|nr:PREDICTED: uncharacterized protein LOC106816256 isoform X1 [Priapulus caudatus]